MKKKYLFREIVDVSTLEETMQHFYNLTGLPFNITDNDGKLITAIGPRNVCMEFFRKNPETLKKCQQADQWVNERCFSPEPYLVHECENGLIHVSKPILVDGIHLATMFLGQFFLTPPNEDIFRHQAQEYGFDEKLFLAAIKKTPIIPRAKIGIIMRFYSQLGKLVSQVGLREKLTRDLILSARDSWIWEMDRDLTLKRVEGYSKEILGYSPEEMIKKSPFDFSPPGWSKSQEGEKFKKIKKKPGRLVQLEHPLLSQTGELVEVSTTAIPFFDNDGELKGYRGIDKDVTGTKKAEQALQNSEKRFRQLFNSMDTGFSLFKVSLDPQGNLKDAVFVEVNPAYQKVTGLNVPEGLAGRKLKEISPSFFEEQKKNLAFLAANDNPINTEEYSPALKRFLRCKCYQASPGYVAYLISDVTDLKEAEHAILINMSQALAAQTIGRLGYWEYDLNTQMITIPAKTRELFKNFPSQKEHLSRKEFGAAIYLPDRPRVVLLIEDAINHPRDFQVEFRLGEEGHTWVRLLARFNPSPQGNLVLHGTAQDITDLKKVESRLSHAQKMEAVGRLAGGVAHDFNNLLHSILGYAELLERELGHKPDAIRKLARIRKAGDRAKTLIRQLMTVSQKQDFIPYPCDLNNLINEALRILSPALGENIKIEFNPTALMPPAMADPSQIDQVLMNLCINARDAMKGRGIITIATGIGKPPHRQWSRRKSAFISVSDTGPGIPPEALNHIFEPFFSSKEEGKGTGLGLSIVYSILERHGGSISVKNNDNGGAKFTLWLPISTSATPQKAKGKSSPATQIKRSGTILLAEDDNAVRELATQVLAEAGFSVVAVENGLKAVNTFKQEPKSFDLLVFDLIMPEINGKRAYEEIAAINPRIPILFCSAYGDELISSDFLAQLPGELLRKPYSRENILEAIDRLLKPPKKASKDQGKSS